ncbi:hypothetical protein BDN71DRAFT_1509054 [Pleurotus eryngii]|uniref:Uncharacterized protein n=1 Tax=Pleurotus eryngii TaxID=5323 RepID=A0A9P6DEW8_PLEER|nr:hypothetical protein BDN71DRAFT_1509054 [Pleurotus eryngii]
MLPLELVIKIIAFLDDLPFKEEWEEILFSQSNNSRRRVSHLAFAPRLLPRTQYMDSEPYLPGYYLPLDSHQVRQRHNVRRTGYPPVQTYYTPGSASLTAVGIMSHQVPTQASVRCI